MVADIATYGMLTPTILLHAMQRPDISILFKTFDTQEENSKMNDELYIQLSTSKKKQYTKNN